MFAPRCVGLLAALLVTPSLASSQATAVTKRVLVLYEHNRNAPGQVTFTNELRAVAEAEATLHVEFYDELLDLDRFPGSERLDELKGYIASKYRDQTLDAIMAPGSSSLQFALDELNTVFPGVPVVYGPTFDLGIDFAGLPPYVTGRRQPLPFADTYALARVLHPDAERVVLIGGTSAGDSVLTAAAVRDLAPLLGGMELEVWQDWSYDELLRDLRALSPRTIAILSSMRRDRSGQQFNSGDLVAGITAVASAPVYGLARNWVGDGIVGGAVMDFGEDGRRVGRMLLQVLTRARGDPLPPPEVADLTRVVDARQLQRWGVSEQRLPAGTEVIFRTPSAWERFRVLIVVVGGLVAAESVLVTWLLLERRRRLRAQRAVEESRRQLAHIGRVATLGELTAAISHELRQPLAAMRAHAEVGQLLLDRSPPDVTEAREVFQDIVDENVRAAEVMDQIRALLRKGETAIVAVDLNDVCRRATDLLKEDAVRRGVQLRIALQPELPRVVGDGIQLQQVILNLALNAMDAAQASPRAREVVVATSAEDGTVELSVRDTGPGLPPEARLRIFEPFFSTKAHGLGMGLAIVRSIVERHHGRVRAENGPDGGAVFRVRLPAGEAAAEPSRFAALEGASAALP